MPARCTGPYETENPVKVEEIGSNFISYDMLAFDTQIRNISDEKMSGNYDNSIHMKSPGGLDYIRNICTWDIKKQLDINPIIRNTAENWDEDPEPSEQNSNGDGISLYEEYRGFEDDNYQHKRLNPQIKELFVRDEDGLVKKSGFDVVSGLRLFYRSDDGWTGEDEWSDSFYRLTIDPEKRIVNFNTSDFGHIVDQHALHVVMKEKGEIILKGEDSYGCVFATLNQKSPASTKYVAVFVDEIVKDCREDVESEMDRDDKFVLTHEEIEAVIERFIIVTTLHEMGHGVGVEHHAPVFSGGDLMCVMRYFNLADIILGFAPWPSIFSRQSDCNNSSVSGGSCWSQIQVSDK